MLLGKLGTHARHSMSAERVLMSVGRLADAKASEACHMMEAINRITRLEVAVEDAVCVQVQHASGSPAAHGGHLRPCDLQRGRVQHPIQRPPARPKLPYWPGSQAALLIAGCGAYHSPDHGIA